MSQGRKGIFAQVEKVKDKFFSLVFEEDVEIIDNGLDEVEENISNTEERVAEVEKVVKEEPKIKAIEHKEEKEDVKVKGKNPFVKPKQKTLEEDLFKDEEEEKTTMELIKENPVEMVEIMETRELDRFPSNKSEVKYEKAQVAGSNVTDELTNEQKEAQEFYAKVDSREAVIRNLRRSVIFRDIEDVVFGEGFEDTFYSLMDAIEDNMVLSSEQKLKKMNQVRIEFFNVNDNDDEEVYNYFKMIRHELYKAKNGLGEYNEEVARNRELQIDAILNYKIADLYENKETKKMLLESDLRSFTELMSLTEAMIIKLEDNSLLKTMPEKKEDFKNEYIDMLWLSNNICDIMTGIEMLKMDISDISNGRERFSGSNLLGL